MNEKLKSCDPKGEDSVDRALRQWRELCEYEKENGINIPSFGTMNDLGKRSKRRKANGKSKGT